MSQTQQKIRIKLKSYDHNLVDKSAEKIVKAVKATGAMVSGPIPLPTKKEKFTVLRSPHVNKKAREQFQLCTYKRLIDIFSQSPKTVEALEKYGCSTRIISFVLPLGYSFNLDGSIMYMTFATVFIAQAYGIDMTISQEITMMLMLLVTSKGMAGVPRASLVVIAGMLSAFNIPEAGLLLLLGIDQLLDMGRSATNVVGNAVATAVVCKWEGELKQ